MVNAEVREAIENSHLKQWQIADCMNISETTLCRWLRKELTEEKKELILSIIKSHE